MRLLERLRIRLPIILAPMGGGPGTPELAAAVSNAGGLGSLAGAYLTPDQIGAEIRRLRALSDAPFAVNLFAGGYHERTDADPAPILSLLTEVHRELGIAPPSMPQVPPDPFREQLAAIIESGAPVFSFTFGIPAPDAIAELRARGIAIIGTATTVGEAEQLEAAGVDAIALQGAEAGAHRGTFAAPVEDALIPTLELVRAAAARVRVPLIASGGIMSGGEIAEALRAGAEAVQLGTAFLLCPEAGTSRPWRRALREARGDDTVITRAFSGRAARGIRNAFIEQVSERGELILPFPIQNSLTRPMRAAASQQDNKQYLSLWAGMGVDRIRELPAPELVRVLTEELAATARTPAAAERIPPAH